MSARTALLLAVLWACTLAWTYRFADENATNAFEAKKVPALVQSIEKHNVKADAGHKVEVSAAVRAAKTEANFEKIESEVVHYAQTHPAATDCSIDADGLRLWRAANTNTGPFPSREPDNKVPEDPAAAGERQDGGPAEQPRPGGEGLSRVPGKAPGLGGLDGEDSMTDVFDRATEVESLQREDALAGQRRRAQLEGKSVTDSAIDCAVCESPIPEARREAVPGVQTCVECQVDLERACRTNSGGRT